MLIKNEILKIYFKFWSWQIPIFKKPFLSFKAFWPFEKNSNKICLYPGSFNPWHEGHTECVKQFLEVSDMPLLILPDCNPWKDNLEGNIQSVFKANKIFKNKKIAIYPGFIFLGKKNPTYEWLKDILFSDISLLMGDDTYLSIHKWHEAKNLLLKLNSIYVVPRNSDLDQLEKQVELLKNLNPSLQVHFLKPHAYQKISSTLLRTKNLT